MKMLTSAFLWEKEGKDIFFIDSLRIHLYVQKRKHIYEDLKTACQQVIVATALSVSLAAFVSPINVVKTINVIPTINVIKIDHKCNTNHKCNYF